MIKKLLFCLLLERKNDEKLWGKNYPGSITALLACIEYTSIRTRAYLQVALYSNQPRSAVILYVGLFCLARAETQQPKQFFLDFVDAYLVYQPRDGSLQIATELMVLSYGQNWEVKQLQPFLYHMRLKTWKGFFWQVNTSRKVAYKVEGGSFDSPGGTETVIAGIKVEVVAGSDSGAPDSFLLKFSTSYLGYEPSSGTLQIVAELMVLSYGQDWEAKEVKPSIYHIRLKTWQGFFWQVSTLRKEAYKVEKGTFGVIRGSRTKMQMGVRLIM
jgi:hypothetical protein